MRPLLLPNLQIQGPNGNFLGLDEVPGGVCLRDEFGFCGFHLDDLFGKLLSLQRFLLDSASNRS